MLKRSEVDPCLYIIFEDNLIVIIFSTHVDDYIVGSNSQQWYDNFIAAFKKEFTINVLGELDQILQLGVYWNKDKTSVSLCQSRYIMKLGQEHGLTDCKPIQTPAETGLHLAPETEPDTSLPYRRLIGGLLWIARATRPDILFIVIYLARFSASYGQQH